MEHSDIIVPSQDLRVFHIMVPRFHLSGQITYDPPIILNIRGYYLLFCGGFDRERPKSGDAQIDLFNFW